MLSNPRLVTFMRLVPVETIIIDEASQIEIGDYIPVLCRFPRLQKLVFIGDDKQCWYRGRHWTRCMSLC
jgi:regulator of nonsense transcripts 1